MTNEDMNKCLTSLEFREIHIKTQWDRNIDPLEWQKLKQVGI